MVSASPTKTASVDGTCTATLPGEWPGIPMMTGLPGRSSTVPVRDLDDLLHVGGAHRVLAQPVGEEGQCRSEPHGPHRRLRLLARAGAMGVCRVDEHRCAGRPAQSLGEADVVAVTVGEDEARGCR